MDQLDLTPWFEEQLEPLELITEQRHAAGRGLEQSAGGAVAQPPHGIAGDVQRQAAGTEKGCMLGGRQMSEVPYVTRKTLWLGVHRASDREVLIGTCLGRREQQLLQLGLA